MAALKVFISSTCYDLSIVRSELRSFIYNLGHEPVMSEYNDILFDPKDHTHESCVNEIRNTDAVVLIIGSRFGGKAIPQAVSKINIDYLKNTSKSTEIFNEPNKISITQMEIFKAIELDIPIYTFVDSKVLSDHHLYEKNKDKEFINQIEFPSIDKKETALYIFEFINFLRLRGKNNSIFEFSKISDIEDIIKKQWSALFQRLLHEQKRKAIDSTTNRLFIDGLQDIKSLILSTINTGDGKEIGKGVLRYRRLIEFCSSIINLSDAISLLVKDISWDELLKAMHIIDIKYISRNGKERPVLIREDGTFYRFRFMTPTHFIDVYSQDWDRFKMLKPDVKENIIAAISESDIINMGPIVFHVNEQFSDFCNKNDSIMSNGKEEIDKDMICDGISPA